MNEKNLQSLYNSLKRHGYEMSSFDEFKRNMADDNKRRQGYDAISKEFNLPDYDQFSKDMGFGAAEPAPQSQPQQTETPQPTAQPQQPPKVSAPLAEGVRLPNASIQSALGQQSTIEDMPQPQSQPQVGEFARQQVEQFNQAVNANRAGMFKQPTLRDEIGGIKAETYNPDAVAAMERAYTSFEPKTVEEQIADIEKRIDQRQKELYNERNKQQPVNSFVFGAGAAPSVPNVNTNEDDEELQTLIAARDQLYEAKKAKKLGDADVADNKAGNTGLWGFFKGAGRGLASSVFDLTTWDFGVSDLSNSTQLLEVAQKAERGEKLTQAEDDLLTAASINAAAQSYLSEVGGYGTTAGKITGESLPFMLEFAINPLSGSSSSIAKYGAKKFGVTALKKGIGKKLAKAGLRTAGDVAAAAGMTATTGATRVAADATQRMTGNILPTYDEFGYVQYGGREGAEDNVASAVGKAAGSAVIENYSELLGAQFAPMLNAGGKFAKDAAEKVGLKKVTEVLSDISGSNFAKGFRGFLDKTQWHGPVGEYFEEVASNILNAAFVGDMKFDASEEGVFNLENNIDTFLGVALMGGAFSAINTAGYAVEKAGNLKLQRQLKNESVRMSEMLGDKWADIKDQIDNAEDEQLSALLTGITYSNDYTAEQKKGIWQYAAKLKASQGANMVRLEQQIGGEFSPQINDVIDGFEAGYMAPLSEAAAIKAAYDDAVSAYEQNYEPIGDNLNDAISEAIYVGDQTRADALVDIAKKKAAFEGIKNQARDNMQDRIDNSNAHIDRLTNQGMVIQATLKEGDKPVFITSGAVVSYDDGTVDTKNTSDFLVGMTPEGEVITFGPGQLLRIDSATPADAMKYYTQQEILREEAETINNVDNGTVNVQPGETYSLVNAQGEQIDVSILQDNGDGTFLIDDGLAKRNVPAEQIQQMLQQSMVVNARTLREQQEVQREQQYAAAAESVAVEPEQTVEEPTAEESIDETVTEQQTEQPQPIMVGDEFTNAAGETGIVQSIDGDGAVITWEREDGSSYTNRMTAEDIAAMQAPIPAPVEAQPEASATPSPEELQAAEQAQTTVAQTPESVIAEMQDFEPEERQVIVNNNIQAAEQAYNDILSAKPVPGMDIAAFRQEKAEWQANVEQARANLDFWNSVNALLNAPAVEEAVAISEETQPQPPVSATAEAIAQAEAETNTEPTEAQKEAGNYKKGHVVVDGMNITIEQPKGSVRRGTDANGKAWETVMNNTYGYIRGTQSVDGDHIDIFLSDNPETGNVYVVDQVNNNGSFDEHKVMYGFNSVEEARAAYLSNYEEGWQGLGNITEVSKEDFKKWLDSSTRKTKPFAEYASTPAPAVLDNDTEGAPQDVTEEAAPADTGVSQVDVSGLMQGIEEKGEAKLSDYATPVKPKKATSKKAKTEQPQKRLVSDERYAELRERMRKKLGQLNVGIDPEIIGIGAEMAVYHLENGAIKFADYARNMIADLGDAIRPFLKSLYSAARDYPGVEGTELGNNMTPYDEVRNIDVNSITLNVEENERETTEDAGAVIAEGETVLGETASVGADSTEAEVNEAIAKIEQIEAKTNEALALLGYYDTEGSTDKDFNEAYGYLKAAEKKFKKDLTELSKRLAKDLGLEHITQKGKKVYASTNIAPAGGDGSIMLKVPGTNRVLYINIHVEPNYKGDYEALTLSNEPYGLGSQIMYRMEDEGYKNFGSNNWANNKPYDELLKDFKRLVSWEFKDHVFPEAEAEEPKPKKKAKRIPKKKEGQSILDYAKEVADAFGSDETNVTLEEQKQEQDGLQRNDAELRSEGLPADGSEQQGELSDGTGASGESEQQESGRADGEGAGRSTEPDRTVRPRPDDSVAAELESKSIEGKKKAEREDNKSLAERLKGVSLRLKDKYGVDHIISGFAYYELANMFHLNDNIEGPFTVERKDLDLLLKNGEIVSSEETENVAKKNTRNNHSERGEVLAPTSVDARIEANIKAIELAQNLIENGEQATESQMKTLRKFSGWGGLGKAFQDPDYSQRLKELLGEEAYNDASESSYSAYYTPTYIADTLWDIAEKLGFKGGVILEGSAGIGNLLGQMPTSISERSDIHAVEKDTFTGNILKLLYPDAKVDIQGFEETQIPNGSVDLAITNVPFVTGLHVYDNTGDNDLSKKFRNIHDFCIAKNVRKLKEGGIGIFITTSGTLDNSKKLRDWVVNEGGSDFIGAFRMNNKTFIGTKVTTDIIVIRKRVNGQKSANAIDVSTVSGERVAEYDTGETKKVKGNVVPVIKQLSMDYNRYFIEHPENMAGEMAFGFEHGDTYRPTSKTLVPQEGKDQSKMLQSFVETFSPESAEAYSQRQAEANRYVMDESAEGKKLGEMYEKDGQLVIAGLGGYYPLNVNANKVKGKSKLECFNAYNAIKTALKKVLDYQVNNESDAGLKPLLKELNKAYDDFVATFGHFNKNVAISFLKNDVEYSNIFSLETYEETSDKKGNRVQKFGKSDVFKGRVIEKEKELKPTNVKDGILISIFKFGRIDVPYISEQLGMSPETVKEEIVSSGYGFENPITTQMEVSYQYLSGNVREKLRQAEQNNVDGKYDANIKALKNIIPLNIPAHLIDFSLGSSWITPKLYQDFIKDKTDLDVNLIPVGGTWDMSVPYYVATQKNRAMGVVSEALNKTIFGHTLIEAAMQNKTITVSQTYRNSDGTTETVIDKEATRACAAKIEEIRQDFKDWARQKMQSDEQLSQSIENTFNDMFNNYVPMSIPDDFVPEYFSGASHRFKMRPHQGKAIVRGTMQPLLLAHEVGTGKTFTLISTAMEMRRLGTARKPMIVVQNATVGQFVSSAKELYPNAKILTLEESDRSAEGRKNFYAKIKYNDWDMIVVPQSTFEFIPDSEERQMAFVQDKIEEKLMILEQMKNNDSDGNSLITRQAEKEIEQLESELAELTKSIEDKRDAADEKRKAIARQNAEVQALEMLDRRTDAVENFDDMGIDALLVDEAHEYKHLGFATAMQRGVKGVDPSYSKKSQGVYLKTQAVLEKNNGKNVIFATGTPISNTAAEIWTFMRYLMPADTMKDYEIYYFDDFVRNFGNIQQMLEFTTSGKFKENNRFAGYVNLPELVRIWSGVSDTVLTKEAGEVQKKIPEIEGGKAQDIFLPQTMALRSVMKFVNSELNKYEQMSGKEKKANSHIPLTMYGIAKAAAVDARLVLNDAIDEPNSKTNEAVRQTLKSLKDTKDYKGTVAIFADNYQNKESGFNLYEDIRNKLIASGVPEEQIVVMKSNMSIKKKLDIFDKVNKGEIRVILGSTFTLGTGVNIQERLHTLIHLDAPNRPMDYTQRNGRILRQGNIHKEMGKPVRILRFGVEDSLDVTAYQRLKTKGAIADSIMSGKQMMQNSMVNRVLEEEEDAFGDIVAQLSGSEYALLKNNAEKNVRKYESRKKQWEADQAYIHSAKPRYKAALQDLENILSEQQSYLDKVQEAFKDGKADKIEVGKKEYSSLDDMAPLFKDHNKSVMEASKALKESNTANEQKRELEMKIGPFTFKFTTTLSKETVRTIGNLSTEVKRKITYSCPELGLESVPVKQSLLKNGVEDIIENVITGKDFSENVESAKNSISRTQSEIKQLSEREGKPFEFEKELQQSKEQLETYSELMKKELEEKEAKYAEMDKEAEDVTSLSNAEEESEEAVRQREVYGDDVIETKQLDDTVYDDEDITNSVNRLASSMNAKVKVVSNISELPETATKRAIEKGRNIKGWYDTATGEVVVYLPNTANEQDARQTVFHEVVGHKGLREMFGSDFNTFLQNVYSNASTAVRKRIAALASKNGWNISLATEEYLATLAEKGFDDAKERSFFQSVKDAFINLLRKAGISLGFKLTDKELRYILWRSYQMQQNKGIVGEAENVAMQMAMKVGNYAPKGDVLFRDSTAAVQIREDYDKKVTGLLNNLDEAYHDYLRSVRITQELIEKKSGSKIQDFEDVYKNANRKSSVDAVEIREFHEKIVEPFLEHASKMIDGKSIDGQKMTSEHIDKYLHLLHAPERNEVFARRDARRIKEEEIQKLDKQKAAGLITDADYNTAKSEAEAKELENYNKFRENDYSGLTEMFGEGKTVQELEALAKEYTDKFEKIIGQEDIDILQNDIKQISRFTLNKTYESGIISRKTMEELENMFEHYVPLRGFKGDVASDVYEYVGSEANPGDRKVVKEAKGRKSVADSPIANLLIMGTNAIVSGNKNKLVKMSLLNLAENHPTDLLTVSSMWYEKQPDGTWEPKVAKIPKNATAKEVAQIVEAFEEDMKVKAKAGMAKRRTGKSDIPLRVLDKKQESQHAVRVMRNGTEYVVYINGNPKLAQAVNGLLNIDSTDNPIWKKARALNGFFARLNTSWSPEFIARNLARDIVASSITAAVKEGPKYTAMFEKNLMNSLSPIGVKGVRRGKFTGMYNLYMRYKNGKLDMNNQRDKYFYEFIKNGGETGITQMLTIDSYKNKMKKMVDNNGFIKFENAAKAVSSTIVDGVDFLNKGVENACRFSAYMTSRQLGKSITESIYDAKEISVNFNRKGSGAMGNRLFVTNFMFFNAAMQGLFKQIDLFKKHPAKMAGLAFGLSSIAFLMALICINSGDDGDDEEMPGYFDINPFTRRGNFMVPVGDGKFAKMPLAYEVAVWYGMGDILATAMYDEYSRENTFTEIGMQLASMLPLDVVEGKNIMDPERTFLEQIGKAFIPSYAKPFAEAWGYEQDFLGRPINNRTDFNEHKPEWQRAKKNTSQFFIGLSKGITEITGGSKYRKGSIDNVTINPGSMEHLTKSLTGGLGTFVLNTSKTVQALMGEEDYKDAVNIPFARSFYMNLDNDYYRNRRINERWYFYDKEYESLWYDINSTIKDTSIPVDEKQALIDSYKRNGEYEKVGLFRGSKDVDGFMKISNRLDNAIREAESKGSEDEVEKLYDMRAQFRRKAVNVLDSITEEHK